MTNNLAKIFIIIAVILVGGFLIFQPIYSTNAAGLVPCGQSEDDPKTLDVKENKPCTTCDLLVLGSTVINFILFTITPAVAVLLYLIAGFMIILGGANPGQINTGKNIFKTTTYGLFIIFGAWMITNTVLKSLAGEGPFTGKWYEVTCSNPDAGSGGGDNVGGGNSGGETLSCVFNGVDYSTFNLCTGLSRPGGCGTSVCGRYSSSIDNYADGAATAALLKAMMVIESDCNIGAATGSSYGLMQLRPSTANQFRNRCGILPTDPLIDSRWLRDPANADKSICLAAAFINSIAGGTCGSEPRNIYAGYNAGPSNCAVSSDCSNEKSCDGKAVKKWECPYNNSQHTICNTGFYQTKQGAAYINYCLDNLGF